MSGTSSRKLGIPLFTSTTWAQSRLTVSTRRDDFVWGFGDIRMRCVMLVNHYLLIFSPTETANESITSTGKKSSTSSEALYGDVGTRDSAIEGIGS